MDFLCFTIKDDKIAIRIIDIHHLVDNTELTHFSNLEHKSVYLIKYRHEIVPVFEINNDFDVDKKSIVLIDGSCLFGVFVDSIDDIFRNELPIGYKLVAKEDFESMVRNGNDQRASDVELF